MLKWLGPIGFSSLNYLVTKHYEHIFTKALWCARHHTGACQDQSWLFRSSLITSRIHIVKLGDGYSSPRLYKCDSASYFKYTSIHPIFSHNPSLSYTDLSVRVLIYLHAPLSSGNEACSPPNRSTLNYHNNNHNSRRTTTLSFWSSPDKLLTNSSQTLFCILKQDMKWIRMTSSKTNISIFSKILPLINHLKYWFPSASLPYVCSHR